MTKDEIENKRLLKTYGITLEDYRQELAAQHGCCKICSVAPKTQKLSVDHDHRVARTKIVVRKIGPTVWAAQAFYCDTRSFYSTAATRRAAWALVHKYILQRSIRGLLCHRCNRGLNYFADSPGRLQIAARYLSDYYDKLSEGEPRCQQQ